MSVLHSGNYVLNGNAVLGPDDVVYQEKPVVGLRLDGIPQKQGYNAMEWHYQTVPGDEMKLLLDAWVATRGQGLSVTFINRNGVPQTDFLYMQEPVIGRRRTFFYDSVVIRFTASYRTGIDTTAPLQAGSSAGYDRFLTNELILSQTPSVEVDSPLSVSQSYFYRMEDSIRAVELENESGGGGPFLHGTTLYAPRKQDGTNDIAMWSSDVTDGAVWQRQDTALTSSSGTRPMARQVGATIYVLYDKDDHAELVPFDCVTNTWGSVLVSSEGQSGVFESDSWAAMFFAFRGSDIVIFSEKATEGWGDARYSIYRPGTGWIATDQIISDNHASFGDSADYWPYSVVTDNIGDTHFLWWEGDYTLPYARLCHRTLKADNTLTARTEIATDPSRWNDWMGELAIIDDAGTPTLVTNYPIDDGIDGDFMYTGYAEAPLTGSYPLTWTAQQIATIPEGYSEAGKVIQHVDGTISLVWNDGTDSAAYRIMTRTAGTWGPSRILRRGIDGVRSERGELHAAWIPGYGIRAMLSELDLVTSIFRSLFFTPVPSIRKVIGVRYPVQLNVAAGPFRYGTHLYVVVAGDNGTAVTQVWKSNDGTAWTEMDSAHHPDSGQSGNEFYTFSAYQQGTTLVVSTAHPEIFVDFFDTLTDSWSDGPHVSGPIVGRGSDWTSMYVGRRSGGASLVGQDNFLAAGGANTTIKYNVYTGTPDWANDYVVGTNDDGTDYMLLGVCMLGDDQLFVWRERAVGGSGSGTIKSRVLDSSNSLGTVSTIGSCTWDDWASPLTPYSNAGVPSVGIVHVGDTGQVSYLEAAQSTLTSWASTVLVASPTAFIGNAVLLPHPTDHTILRVLWLSVGHGIAMITRTAGTWGASAMLVSGPFTAFSATYTNAIDIVARIGSTMVYMQVTP